MVINAAIIRVMDLELAFQVVGLLHIAVLTDLIVPACMLLVYITWFARKSTCTCNNCCVLWQCLWATCTVIFTSPGHCLVHSHWSLQQRSQKDKLHVVCGKTTHSYERVMDYIACVRAPHIGILYGVLLHVMVKKVCVPTYGRC